MKNFINSVCVILVGFFGTIYITSPLFIAIYELMLYDTIKVKITKTFAIGFILMWSMLKLNFRDFEEVEVDYNKRMIKQWVVLITIWIYYTICYCLANMYIWYLS